jgi:serine/threonine protein kinase
MVLIPWSGTSLPASREFNNLYVQSNNRVNFIIHITRRAKNIKTNRFVAIKELHNVFDKDILKRLLREIRLLRHFEGHQNVRSHSLWLQIKKYSGFQQKSKIFLRFSKSRVGIMVPDVTLELFQKEVT